ncbi:hypothetical protein HOLleu_11154 [Holothuria leucospilota]|uniref:C17orf113 probable zinc finger domain-containing protein n=1 Tax=Holothuria leucospilota TaxID=206669 RepID=A0A9Q1CG55_HOLLE|nr:hypothetical protein HOLleu_11154 [Holothuria leucospilota]
MWRFLSGVEPPSKKQKVDKKVRDKEYEQKRERKFQSGWRDKFSWVRHENNTMFCAICRNYPDLARVDGAFYKGTTNYMLQSLTSHALSKEHIKIQGIEDAKIIPPGQSVAEKTLMSLNQKQHGQLTNLFKTCHAIIKHGRPYTDFVWQCDLDESKGVDIGHTYRSDKEAAIFGSYIA